MATNVDKFVEPAEVPAATAVPIGGVILWQNPDPAAADPPPPTGFEYCDGTNVSTGGSPMIGQAKPDLMVTGAGGTKGIVRGADVSSSYGDGTALVTGGADTHLHTGGTTSNGSHSHTVNSHTHSISTDGNHDHQLLGPTSGKVTFDPSTPAGPDDITDIDGNHSHGGSTGSSAPNTNTQSNHSHSFSSNASSSLPRFVELAFIIRVV